MEDKNMDNFNYVNVESAMDSFWRAYELRLDSGHASVALMDEVVKEYMDAQEVFAKACQRCVDKLLTK
jgi:hypothetical protein